MSNKPFDLEKALSGEPVVLRNGDKAFVFKLLQNKNLKTPLIGYHINSSGAEFGITWTINGDYSACTNENDIIGMWQESRPRVLLDLPAPVLKPEPDKKYYTLVIADTDGYDGEGRFASITDWIVEIEDGDYDYQSKQRIEEGLLFETKSDAQEWLDAMRNVRR